MMSYRATVHFFALSKRCCSLSLNPRVRTAGPSEPEDP